MREALGLTPDSPAKKALDSLYSPTVAGLARLSSTWAVGDPAESEPGVPTWAVPAVGCQREYQADRYIQLLAECLPFAPRGLLSMVEPENVTPEQAAADAKLASALGRAGFLVVILAKPSWPRVDFIPSGYKVRLDDNVFLESRHDPLAFLQSYIQANDPIFAPLLLMGRIFGTGAEIDAGALERAGAHVYVVGGRDHDWADEEGSSSSSDNAFLSWAACEPAIEGMLLRSKPAATRMSRMDHCSPRVRYLRPGLAGEAFTGLPVADAEAAQIAAVISEDVVMDDEAEVSSAHEKLAKQVEQFRQAEAEILSSKPPVHASAARPVPARPAPASLEVTLPGRGRPIPVHRQRCRDSHSMIVTHWLAKCMPGRRGLFVMSLTIPWDIMLFQRPQHVARAMAVDERMLVLYFAHGRRRGLIEAVPDAPGVFVADEAVVVQGAVTSLYSTMVVTALTGVADIEGSGGVAVYEYIDAVDEAISGSAGLDTMRRGRDISSACASVVLYSALALKKDLRPPRPGAFQAFVPNGVYLPQYDVPDDAPVPAAIKDSVQRKRPIVGYFGAVAGWLWLELIEEVARAVPEADFEIIGPPYMSVQLPQPPQLPPNLRYIGAVPSKQLVLHASHWSVGIIPFRHGEVAETTSPLKLFEYFAMGLPVVVTDSMSECVRFKEVRRAHDPAGFAKEVRAAIADSRDEHVRARMRELGAENSWSGRAHTIITAATMSIRLRLQAAMA